MNIIVIIGTHSSVGKTTLAATIGSILQNANLSVEMLKFDGYFNYNAGTMNPYGKLPKNRFPNEEVIVTPDGWESDSDIGVYERFLFKKMYKKNNITNGEIIQEIVQLDKNFKKEGDVIFSRDIIDLFIKKISTLGRKKKFVVLEVGGSIDDYENILILKSINKLRKKNKILIIFLSRIFFEENIPKTRLIRRHYDLFLNKNLPPNFIILRSQFDVNKKFLKKIARQSNLSVRNIFFIKDIDNIYELPVLLEKQNFSKKIFQFFNLKYSKPKLKVFKEYNKKYVKKRKMIKLLLSDNTESFESYVSLINAIKDICVLNNLKAKIKIWERKKINIPPNGIILTEPLNNKDTLIKYANKKKIPILGISGGACSLLKFYDKKCKIMKTKEMTLGSKKIITEDILRHIYKKRIIKEVNRHNYNICNNYVNDKIKILGKYCNGQNICAFQIKNKNQIGVLYHPEFNSNIKSPNPLLNYFILTCSSIQNKV